MTERSPDIAKSKDQYGLIKVVKKLEIFRALAEDEGLHILSLCQRRAFAKDELVWKASDEEGKVLGQVLSGASFGEMA